mmetsp:Transcript_22442/g.31681  ORF Transcript_22442/g.31681 Transcript_22442/m.31681 type:complete len:150 (-) Transcript_22442:143-592(-)|eukprot:CAMPEP_0175097620 /NCGR_PEP_ID=MMETSP0086_2-20121207/5385_1 /TAXON_ID=136419 /ORGANISM="Unknown Unknown, Strain D1" /LENGTH=149 /DNA_ID=CAMNT_0016371145 /DNA_START=33 /DNA_END=482 /DNA_ORIENTATION=+
MNKLLLFCLVGVLAITTAEEYVPIPKPPAVPTVQPTAEPTQTPTPKPQPPVKKRDLPTVEPESPPDFSRDTATEGVEEFEKPQQPVEILPKHPNTLIPVKDAPDTPGWAAGEYVVVVLLAILAAVLIGLCYCQFNMAKARKAESEAINP